MRAKLIDRFVQLRSDSAAAVGWEDVDLAEVGIGGRCERECRSANDVVAVDGE
jgi:hypothetical protein